MEENEVLYSDRSLVPDGVDVEYVEIKEPDTSIWGFINYMVSGEDDQNDRETSGSDSGSKLEESVQSAPVADALGGALLYTTGPTGQVSAESVKPDPSHEDVMMFAESMATSIPPVPEATPSSPGKETVISFGHDQPDNTLNTWKLLSDVVRRTVSPVLENQEDPDASIKSSLVFELSEEPGAGCSEIVLQTEGTDEAEMQFAPDGKNSVRELSFSTQVRDSSSSMEAVSSGIPAATLSQSGSHCILCGSRRRGYEDERPRSLSV